MLHHSRSESVESAESIEFGESVITSGSEESRIAGIVAVRFIIVLRMLARYQRLIALVTA